MRVRPSGSRWVAVAAVAAVAWVAGLPGTAGATGTAAAVHVAAGDTLARVPATGIGLNASMYDGHVTDAAVPGLLRGAGVGLMRFPGGTESDTYDWRTNTDVLGGWTGATSFDQFVGVARQTGAQPMITVNYGTGDTLGARLSPAETGAQVAADWVRYANVTHHDRIRYWEIGNEVYGNGTYGAYWEPDDHCGSVPPVGQPTGCGPATYARVVAAYVAAMKAVDPTIRVGVVLTAPGSWPDGVTAPGSPQPWNQTVLSALAGTVDFADVHWYPQNPSNVTPPGPSDAGLLADTDQIPGIVSTLRTEFRQYAAQPDIPVMLTETNSVSSNPGKQTTSTVNALYLEQDYLGWLTSGVSTVDWWQLHNGIVTSGDNGDSLFGSTVYGDYGVLSDGSCGTTASGQVCEPPAGTPFPAYRGLRLLGQFLRPGDRIVAATSSQSPLRAYAARRADGTLRVMLVNDDPAATFTVGLDYAGFTPERGAPLVSSLAGDGSAITTGHRGSARGQTVPPYSVTLVTLRPAHR
jgi:hypothetical protein